jgi:hypothetical protein
MENCVIDCVKSDVVFTSGGPLSALMKEVQNNMHWDIKWKVISLIMSIEQNTT